MQERIVVENVTTGAGLVRARDRRSPATSPTSSRSRSTTSHSATRCARSRSPSRRRPSSTAEHAQFVLDDPEANATNPGRVLQARRGRRRHHALPRRARPARVLGGDHRRRPQPATSAERSPRPVSPGRFGEELARVHDSLTAWQLHVPQLRGELGRARALLRAVGLRSRVAADARRQPRHHPAAGRRHAVVHDRLRPRHADHLVPDAPVRAGARPRRARGARRAPGDRGRPVDRRRAGEDRPRGPAREGGEGLVPSLLRHRRRDAALPRAALGGVALDAATSSSS